eukprot:563023-Alexandrium_andersonii.AAC.1
MPVGPVAAGGPPGQPAAPGPVAPARSQPRPVPEQVAKDAVAGLMDLQKHAQRMKTPSPERAREKAARDSIDQALSAFTGKPTPDQLSADADREGQAANLEITNHLRQLGVQ